VARFDDEIAVERVFLEAARAAWAKFIPPEGLASLSPPLRWRSETTLVSEVDGREVVGFAVLRRSEDADADSLTGELDLIYTAPSVWASPGHHRDAISRLPTESLTDARWHG